MNFSLSFLIALFSISAIASTHTARIVKLENPSEIYIPGEKKNGEYVHVKYLNSVYHVLPAKKGMKLENGYIVTTGPKSKLKVIFNNGDHIFVAENTQYKIDWKRDSLGPKKDPSVINLMRGAFRGLIQKDGPRSGMKVQTKTATMGVRGTDFYVSEKHGALNVSVLRGEVVLINEKLDNKPVKVLTGQTLTKEDKVISITALAKEDLQQIAKDSVVQGSTKEVKPQTEKAIDVLETKAKEVALNDIKEYQPKIYEEIIKKDSTSQITSDSLATNTVEIMKEKAPHKAKKPSSSDLEDTENPYDQYKFKKD